MALPRIVYNAINLDFPEGLSDFKYPRVRRAGMNTSDGGVTETVRSGIWDELEIVVEMFNSSAFFESLQAFWAWASRGKQFSFAFDSARVVNTTLSGAESAGATVIELASTTGIIVGGKYIMRASDLINSELVTVQSISAGISVTLSAGIKYGYSAPSFNDIFRDWYFWPKLIAIDDGSPFTENPGLTYSFSMRCREDRG